MRVQKPDDVSPGFFALEYLAGVERDLMGLSGSFGMPSEIPDAALFSAR
jgi:hypothetical protein